MRYPELVNAMLHAASSPSDISCDIRETPRGGVFAKIPGLDQHIFRELKRKAEPPKFQPPHLTAGTVRKYDADEAQNAAFR